MARVVFLNIAWMERYEGLKGDDKQISGGGSYVDKAQPRDFNNLERMGANPKLVLT